MKFVNVVFFMVLGIIVMFPATNVLAGESVCQLPAHCIYVDSDFSSGGRLKRWNRMEVTCKMPGNKLIKYVDWELSFGGRLNMGRATAPRKIEFIEGYKDKLDCSF